MKAPKNYYNVVDQKKLGLDQIDKNAAAIAELQELPVLPTPGEGDEGKVLTVDSNGDWGAADIPSQLPSVSSSDEGKVLMVNDQGEWAAAPFNPGAEVTPLNYFQLPSGNPSIILGFKPTDCDDVIIEYHTNGTPGSHKSVISTDQTSWDTRRALNIHYDGTSWYCCNTSIGSYQEGEFEFKFDMVNGKVYQDNVELISFDNGVINDHYLKIGDLGGLSGSSNYGAYFKRIKGIKNNQLIHDLIPMKIGENAYFFIDQITGNIVGGQGWTIAIDTIGG